MQAQEATTKKRTRAQRTSLKEPSSDLSDLDLSSDHSDVPKKQSKKRAKLTTSKGKAAENEEMKEGEKKIY